MQHLAGNNLLVDLNRYREQGDMANVNLNIPMPDDSLQDKTTVEDSMEHDPDAEYVLEENRNSLNKEQQWIFD